MSRPLYEITASNLKWAYKKLKNYVYYYNSSCYLKDKIIQFEKNYNSMYFEELSNELSQTKTFDDLYLKYYLADLYLKDN